MPNDFTAAKFNFYSILDSFKSMLPILFTCTYTHTQKRLNLDLSVSHSGSMNQIGLIQLRQRKLIHCGFNYIMNF